MKTKTRKAEQIQMLSKAFQTGESYVREYEADDGKAINLIQTLNMVEGISRDVRRELIKDHKLSGMADWLDPKEETK